MEQYVEIHWTCANIEEAKRIAKNCVEKKLAACVQIYPEIESIFIWQGKQDSAREVKVVLKTKKALFQKVAEEIKAHASYEVPEIVATPIVEGSPSYLNWVKESTL